MDENGWIQERFVAFPSKREASRCQGQNLEVCCKFILCRDIATAICDPRDYTSAKYGAGRSPSLWIQYCAEYGYQLSIHSNTNDTRKSIKVGHILGLMPCQSDKLFVVRIIVPGRVYRGRDYVDETSPLTINGETASVPLKRRG